MKSSLIMHFCIHFPTLIFLRQLVAVDVVWHLKVEHALSLEHQHAHTWWLTTELREPFHLNFTAVFTSLSRRRVAHVPLIRYYQFIPALADLSNNFGTF